MGNTVALVNSVLCQDSAKRQNKISSSSSHCWWPPWSSSHCWLSHNQDLHNQDHHQYYTVCFPDDPRRAQWLPRHLLIQSHRRGLLIIIMLKRLIIMILIIIIIASNNRLKLKAHCKKIPRTRTSNNPDLHLCPDFDPHADFTPYQSFSFPFSPQVLKLMRGAFSLWKSFNWLACRQVGKHSTHHKKYKDADTNLKMHTNIVWFMYWEY